MGSGLGSWRHHRAHCSQLASELGCHAHTATGWSFPGPQRMGLYGRLLAMPAWDLPCPTADMGRPGH